MIPYYSGVFASTLKLYIFGLDCFYIDCILSCLCFMSKINDDDDDLRFNIITIGAPLIQHVSIVVSATFTQGRV